MLFDDAHRQQQHQHRRCIGRAHREQPRRRGGLLDHPQRLVAGADARCLHREIGGRPAAQGAVRQVERRAQVRPAVTGQIGGGEIEVRDPEALETQLDRQLRVRHPVGQRLVEHGDRCCRCTGFDQRVGQPERPAGPLDRIARLPHAGPQVLDRRDVAEGRVGGAELEQQAGSLRADGWLRERPVQVRDRLCGASVADGIGGGGGKYGHRFRVAGRRAAQEVARHDMHRRSIRSVQLGRAAVPPGPLVIAELGQHRRAQDRVGETQLRAGREDPGSRQCIRRAGRSGRRERGQRGALAQSGTVTQDDAGSRERGRTFGERRQPHEHAADDRRRAQLRDPVACAASGAIP